MSNESSKQIQSQIEETVAGPARTYASLVLEHFEKLTNLQLETAKTYAETGLHQARAALEVKNPSDLQSYVEKQQQVAKELSDRIQGDVEKVTSLNQAFMQNAQKITEDSARKASKTVESATKKAEQDTRKDSQAGAKSQ